MSERGPTLRYDVHERPPLFIAAGLGLQNALFVISGAIFLPILMRSLDIVTFEQAAFLVSATLLTAGLSTAVQAIRIGRVGSGYMLFMGTSGAFFAATMDAIELAGIGFVAALALIAAPTEWLIAHFFRVLRNIFTPTVGGVVVMSVAVLVIPIALDQWQGTFVEGKEGSSEFLLIGAVAALVMNRDDRLGPVPLPLVVAYPRSRRRLVDGPGHRRLALHADQPSCDRWIPDR